MIKSKMVGLPIIVLLSGFCSSWALAATRPANTPLPPSKPAHALAGLAQKSPPALPPATAINAHVDLGPTPEIAIATSPFQNAIAAYQRHDNINGDMWLAQMVPGPEKIAARWVGLKNLSLDAPVKPIETFLREFPDWPAANWLRVRIEVALFRGKAAPDVTEAFFAHYAALSAVGKLALARAEIAEGQLGQATERVGEVWRQEPLNPALETQLHDEFGKYLTIKDDTIRAARMFYRHNFAASLRAVAHIDDVHTAWIQAAIAQDRNLDATALLAKLPATLARDPLLQYAKIVKLQYDPDAMLAAAAMLRAPRSEAQLLNGNVWWHRRREIARLLLDQKHFETAYRLCAQHSAQGRVDQIDAEFHAGWIALDYLRNFVRAERHFKAVVDLALTPMSKARGYYWLARTLKAEGDAVGAHGNFAKAAEYNGFYYGQLAAQELQSPPPMVPFTTLSLEAVKSLAPDLAVQVATILQKFGLRPLGDSLLADIALHVSSPADVQALAPPVLATHDPGLTLQIGKIISERGYGRVDLTFPSFGLPRFQPLTDSVGASLLYAIVRQESAFRTNALSRAGAQGMMQLMVPTARRTAQLEKVQFDLSRLAKDPAYNVQLGAAFLGLLLKEQRGSMILTFAAYNAGGGRVKQWIAAHGDPRNANVDGVDWVEAIPINETRNYVQRVMENLGVYQHVFKSIAPVERATAQTPNVSGKNQALSLAN